MASPDKKIHVSYDRAHRVMRKVAEGVVASGEVPDTLVAIAGGGLIPARMLRSALKRPVISIACKLYDDALNKPGQQLTWIQRIAPGSDEDLTLVRGKHIMLVDDVDDSRRTLTEVLADLQRSLQPRKISVALMHSKARPKHAPFPEAVEVFVGENIPNEWVVYPWDAECIDTHHELARCSQDVTAPVRGA